MDTATNFNSKIRYQTTTTATSAGQPSYSSTSTASTNRGIQVSTLLQESELVPSVPFAQFQATPAAFGPPSSTPSPSFSSVSSTMRRSSAMAEIPLPITYTPTTHRISKAKKGKRVHACEFPGCNKVFTRAEHRRRHELNHNPEASFPCTYDGCRKAFHRSDLLARHMERHELEGQSDSGMPRQWRHQSKSASITSAPSNMVTSVPIDVTSASYPTSQVSTPLSSASPVIGGGIHPDLANDISLPWNGMEVPLQPRPTVFGNHIRDSPDDLPFYSSPDTCGSPASDAAGYVLPPHPSSAPTSVMEPFHYSDLTASPLQLPAAREWDNLDVVSSAPNMMPLALDGNQLIHPVESTLPIPLSTLDGDEWYALRRELTSAPGVVSGNDGMEIIDTVKWQDCLECYWQHFHPLFPIVHRPTFFATKPSPLMAGAMVAIGSQYDTRPNAKEYSLVLLEACLKLLVKRPAITSRSRVTDIQTVFLLEYLSKFRSRKANVQISHRFRSLYGSFMQDRHWVHVNPLAVLNTLPQDCSQEARRRAQKFWVEHEARRRVLQAAFILDVQQSFLFGQPSVSLQPSSAPFTMWPQASQTTNIPFPCNSDLWESRDLDAWLTLARTYVSLSLPSAAVNINRLQGLRSDRFDHFQALLLLSYNLSSRVEPGDDNSILNDPLSTLVTALQDGNEDDPTTSPHSQTLFSYHTLMAARYTPLHTLLTVSGESWLFNQKIVQEGEFRSAKAKLRHWVSDTDDVKKAVWHAVRALRYVVGNTVWQSPSTNAQWHTSGLLPATPVATDPSNMLPTSWGIYICVLICWAYGFEPDNIPSNDGLEGHQATKAHAYIYNMISLTPTWKHVSQANILSSIRCNIYPLLQYIRMTRLQEGRIGGLLNEANRVLVRLSEPRCANGETRGMWSF
ncbi:hypothetical protein UA08_00621 [Talaromyces atroroseus]|uniref:C2H2-type domain-containing protein n=1 Tax=Talaromyces atroroseus TaxID=1441469 RepID=A0A225BB06_TALAT|nr:hypothetical protein UA08_00621 [Talaromyces atroroseus]OKL64095.1 hypothetical protein UA08_00621 [Talaromyces atroroseus]